jgi:hypothetical protein
MDNSIIPANDSELMEPAPANSMAFVMPGDFPDLDNAEVGMSIEKRYFEFDLKGKKIRAVFNGMDFITSAKNGERKQIPAICFQTKEGVFLNSGASLVEQFKSIPPGTPVQIEYLGDAKTASNNNVKKFDVRLLNVAVKVSTVKVEPRSSEPKEEFLHPEMATDYWMLARTMKFTREEGLAHLKAFNNDFKDALDAMKSFN